jgi:hypothetical protein
MGFDKNIRSLKVPLPPPAELEEAKEKILGNLSRVNWQTVRFSIDARTDPEGWKRQKPIIEKITQTLWKHKRPPFSRNKLYNQVVMASCMFKHTAPSVIEEITEDLVQTVNKLYRILGHPDFPPNYRFRIFGCVENWNQFIGCLERSMKITYNKPPKNQNPMKRDCVINAYFLITNFTTAIPRKTRGGLFYKVADLIYQANCPTADDGNTDKLKSTCDKFLNLVRRDGFECAARNRDRW